MPKIYSHLNHVRVRGKSLILLGLIAISYLVMVGLIGQHLLTLDQATTQKKNLDEISFLINRLTFNTFDLHLMTTKILNSSQNLTKIAVSDYKKNLAIKIKRIHTLMETLEATFRTNESAYQATLQEIIEPIHKIKQLLNDLEKNNMTTMEHLTVIGFQEDEGIQGRLRTNIHSIEQWLTEKHDNKSMVDLLQLRRREKDFIMRGHPKSLQLFQEALQTMNITILALSDQPENAQEIARIQEIWSNYQQDAQLLQQELPLLNQLQAKLWEINNAILSNTIKTQNKNYLIIADTIDLQEETLQHTAIRLLLSLTVAFLGIGWMIYLFFQSVLIPIFILNRFATQITQGQYDINISLYGTDEIGELANNLQTMKTSMLKHQEVLEQQVKRRTEHLEITNSVLLDTINQLNATHEELLHSEKMASLGRLVAGFAHEINTPIGISITTISNLPELTTHLREMFNQEEMDEEELESILTQLDKSAQLGLLSLKKAANLVTRFKRISADQASEEARTFNVNEVMQDILTTLHTTFKKTRIDIELICPTQITIHSQPGLLGQVLTNLLMNSHKHGFQNGTQEGKITIDLQLDAPGKNLNLRYTDNGMGIAPKHLNNIFEPFYTTARETGGSGLGLTICYNIVTTQLRGEISCHSEVGKGVVFAIRIPIDRF